MHIQRSDSHTDKHVQILMMNRKLMEDNLTFTPEVYDKLRSWKVLPETMVLDIQVSSFKFCTAYFSWQTLDVSLGNKNVEACK